MSRKRSRTVVEQSEFVTVSELVELSGVRYSTIKYYTEVGFMPFQQEDERMVRRYPRIASLERLELIRKWKSEDRLTIDEIKRRLGV